MFNSTTGTLPTASRMDPGDLREPIAEFITHLAGLGYTRLTAHGYEDSARHFGEWLARSGMTIADINDGSLERFAHHQCCCAGARRSKRLSRKYVRRVRRFVGFLADRKIITAPSPTIALFQDWLRGHRGLSERTIRRHSRMILRLLPALGARWRCGAISVSWPPVAFAVLVSIMPYYQHLAGDCRHCRATYRQPISNA